MKEFTIHGHTWQWTLDMVDAMRDAGTVGPQLTAPHPPKPATAADQDHYAVQHNPAACTVCGLPVTHPIHTLGGTK